MSGHPISRPQGAALFERLAVLHRPDCTAPMQPPPAESLSDEGEIARALASDAAGRYGVAARAVFNDLRRLVGQLAGLLILARLTSRPDHAGLPEVKACREREAEIAAQLAALAAPGPLGPHRDRLSASAGLCRAILDGLVAWRADARGADATFDALNAQIRRAYAVLETCAETRAGLQMIDFSHACCACGGH